jgi:hypothetical protein
MSLVVVRWIIWCVTTDGSESSSKDMCWGCIFIDYAGMLQVLMCLCLLSLGSKRAPVINASYNAVSWATHQVGLSWLSPAV